MQLSKEDRARFDVLLKSIHVEIGDLDTFLSTTPHIYRNLRGHAFEVWFDRQMKERGVAVMSIGGDDVVDRVVNSHTLQLKTPYIRGTVTGTVVGYRMHKTHGKEVKPDCYYLKEEFADYIVGLHPTLGVIICPRDRLPTRKDVSVQLDYPEYLADPMPFAWKSEWLNRYDLLGVDITDPPIISEHAAQEAELFPQLIAKIGFTDYDIVHAILDERNFRTWFQLIVGSIREVHFTAFAKRHGIRLNPPTHLPGRGAQKVDYVLDSGTRVQVKGLTKGMSAGEFLGCETQTSHGRVPNRLYRRTDFDVLAIVIDPHSIPEKIAQSKSISSEEYNVLLVPMKDLPRHPRSDEWGAEYIKSSFKFKASAVAYNQAALLV